jgi:hypothetical protein
VLKMGDDQSRFRLPSEAYALAVSTPRLLLLAAPFFEAEGVVVSLLHIVAQGHDASWGVCGGLRPLDPW